ncbi:MAG: PAS domain S-box protein [Thermodesulfobacteriota bacterium]
MKVDLILEICRTVILGMVLGYLWYLGQNKALRQQEGWGYILAGFALVFMGSLIDITDNFPGLDRFTLIGRTTYQAFLEKVVGYLGGIIFLAVGFVKWFPTVSALREAERSVRYLAAIVESSDDAIIGKNLDGIMESWNLGAERLYGYTAAEALGQPVSILVPADRPDEAPLILGKIMAGERLEHFETVRVKKNGEHIFVSLTVSPIIDDTGVITGASMIARDITSRKLWEQALQESEEKYRLLVKQIPAVVFKGYADWSVDFFDRKVEDLTGYPKEDFDTRRRKWSELILEEDLAESRRKFLEALKDSGTYVRDYRIRKKSGEIAWVQVQGQIFCDAAGRIEYISGVLFDISERRRMEEALRESEEKYRSLFQNNHAIMLLIDTETADIVDANPGACAFYGLSREEMTKKKISDFNMLSSERVAQEMEKAKTRQQEHFQFRHYLPNREIREVEVCTGPVQIQGRLLLYSIIHDITARKQAEAALAEEKERLAVTLRSIGDGVIATDNGRRIVLINQVAEQLTGWTQSEALGRPLSEVFHIINEETRIPCEDPVAKVLETGQVVGLANHTVLIARDGAERLLADSGAPIFDSDHRIIGVVLVFRDVTLQRQMEAELLKLEKLSSLSVLAGGIAHDFNNILTAILGNISLAQLYCQGKEDVCQRLLEAERATIRGRNLAQQLLTFAKGGEPVKELIRLGDLLKESALFATSGSPVRCEFSVPDDLWPVEVDPGQIGQVIQNLAINAVQAMPEGGEMRIAAENVVQKAEEGFPLPAGWYVKITVEDQGMGIPAHYLPRIFDPYFTTKQTGSGLGLATAYSIIKNHGGHITVESQIGGGTRVFIFLAASSHAPAPPRKTEGELLTGKGKILVMDDERMVREVVSKMLNYLGYEVVLAENGAEAIEAYTQAREAGQPFDLVILDLIVPGGAGGQETIEKLRALDSEVKAIVSSGYADDPVMTHYQQYGFSGFIKKPYRVADLSKILHYVLDHP